MTSTGITGLEEGSVTVGRAATSVSVAYPRSKRALDLVLGSAGLLASAPILLVVRAAMVASGDYGDFLYRARRVGEGGATITVFKVRTMAPRSVGSAVTARDDPRVTRVGAALRRYKLDELPQLWNVVRGEMALVGPRPEDPVYVDWADPVHAVVFRARPGITGLAQLAYRNEAELLDGPDPDRTYREVILPAKLQLDLQYLTNRSIGLDLRILVRTLTSVIRH